MPTTRRLARASVLALLPLSLLAAAGCNIVGPAVVLVAGPEKQAAAFELPEVRAVVVFVDDRGSRVPDRTVRRRISEAAEESLLNSRVVTKVIAGDAALQVATRDRFTKPMGIAEIGQAVGAEIVVYATVDEFTLSPDGSTYQPRASVRVKVIDAVEKKRLFPTGEAEWHSVVAERRQFQGTPPTTPAQVASANLDLAGFLGDRIAKVFYTHEIRPIGERLDPEAP